MSYLSPEEDALFEEITEKYGMDTLLLNPEESEDTIPVSQSKMGAEANMAGFESYPCCDACGTPLNFVIQLYKKDFPQLYFPENTNVFQLFRCPNMDCDPGDYLKYDRRMFHYYFNLPDEIKALAKPESDATDIEDEANECSFSPYKTKDLPKYDDLADDILEYINEKLDDDVSYEFETCFIQYTGTKIGGYPSFTQGTHFPVCSSCGKEKELFFQLGSDDDGSSHGIMIGDVGNIYYFVCKDCGPETVEPYWDCC